MSELQILDKVGFVIVVLFVFVRRLDEQIARFPRFPRLIQMKKREGVRFQKISGREVTQMTLPQRRQQQPFFSFRWHFSVCLVWPPKNPKGRRPPATLISLILSHEMKIPASNGGGGIIWYLCDYPVTHCVAPQLNKYYRRVDLTLDQRKPR